MHKFLFLGDCIPKATSESTSQTIPCTYHVNVIDTMYQESCLRATFHLRLIDLNKNLVTLLDECH